MAKPLLGMIVHEFDLGRPGIRLRLSPSGNSCGLWLNRNIPRSFQPV
jgi:hypothetical protein